MKTNDSVKNGNNNQFKKESKKHDNSAPQELLKKVCEKPKFTSTAEIMEAMKEMFRNVIQTVMEVELDEELGRERCQRAEGSGGTPNYRNGHTKKTVKTQLGKVEIQVPRDRNGSFEPKIIGKYSWNRGRHGGKDFIPLFLRHEPAGHRRTDQGAV